MELDIQHIVDTTLAVRQEKLKARLTAKRTESQYERPSFMMLVDNVAELITDGFEFDGKDVRALRTFVVYVVSDVEGRALYVGRSNFGLSRVFDPAHHALKPEVIEKLHKLKVYTCRTKDDAAQLEAELIYYLDPLLNIRR